MRKATGPDVIPTRVLKELSVGLAPVLTVFFQASLDRGVIPSDWKTVIVVPVLKNGEKIRTENYSPVLLTSVMCKLKHMSRSTTKPTKWHVRTAKTQINIFPVWSESSLCNWWIAKDLSFLHTDSKDTDQTGRMPRLIRVFAGRTVHFVGFVTLRLILFAVTSLDMLRHIVISQMHNIASGNGVIVKLN